MAALARLTGRPVRWSQDRRESLTAGIHSRPRSTTCGSATTAPARSSPTGPGHRRRGRTVLYFSGVAPALVTVGSLEGGYDFGTVGFELRCVATTTCPVGAYRGFGQPQAHLSTERVLDRIAAELGLDPLEVRRRNLLPDAPRPWVTGGGARMDVGPLGPHLDQLLDAFDYAGWRRRQAARRAEGRLVGIGLSTLAQGTAPTQYGVAGRFGSYETATVAVLPDGQVTVHVGTKSQGQGHETVLAQVAPRRWGATPPTCGSTTATPTPSPTAWAPGAAGRRSWAAAPCSRRPPRCGPR